MRIGDVGGRHPRSERVSQVVEAVCGVELRDPERSPVIAAVRNIARSIELVFAELASALPRFFVLD